MASDNLITYGTFTSLSAPKVVYGLSINNTELSFIYKKVKELGFKSDTIGVIEYLDQFTRTNKLPNKSIVLAMDHAEDFETGDLVELRTVIGVNVTNLDGQKAIERINSYANYIKYLQQLFGIPPDRKSLFYALVDVTEELTK